MALNLQGRDVKINTKRYLIGEFSKVQTGKFQLEWLGWREGKGEQFIYLTRREIEEHLGEQRADQLIGDSHRIGIYVR